MSYHPVIIQQIHEEVSGFKTFVFEEGHGISYLAGQYLTFIYKTPLEEIRRSYSFTSAPLLKEPMAIGVKRVSNGIFSRELIDHFAPGDQLWTTGAGGFFTLPENFSVVNKIIFFAAGSGITPIFSLLKTVLHVHPQISVMLVYSTPSMERTVFYPALQLLKANYPLQFTCRYLFSNALDLTKARLNRSLLMELMMDDSKSSFETILFYACGPENYMRMITYTLQEKGVAPLHIRRENFITEKTRPVKVLPPNSGIHLVSIYYEDRVYQLEVDYPDTILQAAKKNGLSIPFSCETGRCGNCVAQCMQGNVWLSYNEVLTDHELEKGLTLTCVGHPVGGDVVLKIN